MAVYLVEDSLGNKALVEAKTKQGAINYVAKQEYTATTLTTSDLVQYIKQGLEVESVGENEEGNQDS